MARTFIEPRNAAGRDLVTSFEAAWVVRGDADLADYLPGPEHHDRLAVLRAVVRLDLEMRRGSGQSRSAEDYFREYPEIGGEGLAELALLEYRARLEAGDSVSPEDYRDRLGVDTRGWPSAPPKKRWWASRSTPDPMAALADSTPRYESTSRVRPYPDLRLDRAGESATSPTHFTIPADQSETVEVRVDALLSRIEEQDRFADRQARMPEPGSLFLGFRLLGELGRGAFGRVYLASQGDLAGRPVALKVSTTKPAESQTLAQLQHTNIVPIFSAHSAGPFHAVCMPYFGSTTLKDVFEGLECLEAPPKSGEELLRSIGSRKRGEGSTSSSPSAESPSEVPPRPESPARPLSDTVQMLGKLPFVEAVLWLGSRLADGLAHAHGRGILHRDIKPANILLTDDGQPMLLDFNLSEDTKLVGLDASFGGTLPYMAPEHIRAFRGENLAVDERSDLYSLGIIFYELLAGRHPFETYPGASSTVLARMTEDRQKAPPGLRGWNSQVSPAVESIVRHCLEPDPSRRYQTATQLHEDLERQLANLPLKHAPDPSLRERGGKWARRHPRITSSTSMAIAAGFVLFGLAVGLEAREDRLARLEAADALSKFRVEVATVQFSLNTRTADRDRRARGVTLGREALRRYGAIDNPGWMTSPLVQPLEPEERGQLREEVGEVLLYLARAGALDAADKAEGTKSRDDSARAALLLCDRAVGCFEAGRAPRALLTHRAELLGLLGRDAEARAVRAEADKVSLRSSRDHHLIATGLINQGEYHKALPLAEEATRLDPRDFWAWFALGLCRERIGRDVDADACYSTCIALRPGASFAWFNRAETQLRRDDYKRALADFDRAVALDPAWPEALVDRAIAEQHLGMYARAIADLTRALDLGAGPVTVLSIRATALEKAGDPEGARLDRREAMKIEPRDDQGWVVRALSRMAADPAGALADLDRALTLNPRSISALQDKAHVLSERLNRTEEAVKVLDRAVAYYPDYVPSRSGRGVLLAILGRRDEAHKDAQESLWRETSPRILYQVAGIYAVTSRQAPEDRVEAYRLLSTALRKGFGFDELADDRELDAIRDQPEFRKILDAARALQAAEPVR